MPFRSRVVPSGVSSCFMRHMHQSRSFLKFQGLHGLCSVCVDEDKDASLSLYFCTRKYLCHRLSYYRPRSSFCTFQDTRGPYAYIQHRSRQYKIPFENFSVPRELLRPLTREPAPAVLSNQSGFQNFSTTHAPCRRKDSDNSPDLQNSQHKSNSLNDAFADSCEQDRSRPHCH